MFKIIKNIALIFLILGVGLFIFAKLETSLVANIADAYLRPLLGDRVVIFMEKIFFNSSDVLTRVVYSVKAPVAPTFPFKAATMASSSLDLTQVPPLMSLTPIVGEGVWRDIPLSLFPDREVMASTFIRPDQTRSFAIVSLVKMDMSVLRLGAVAGTKYPGGQLGFPGPGRIPEEIVRSGTLVAAFNGGFQYRDGKYGMMVGGTTYVPLREGIQTLAESTDGSLHMFEYRGQAISGANFIRQNCPPLIDNNQIAVIGSASRSVWGRVVGSDAYTWRSGLGITARGELLYAVGNNLSPNSLAQALKMAGAVTAMQLDINPPWVRFNVFDRIASGSYNSVPLTSDLPNGATSFLNGDPKDFFYVYRP